MKGDGWLLLAKELPEGRSIRVNCVFCPETARSMKLSHTAEGYNVHCFDCKKTRYHRHGLRSISQLALNKSTNKFYQDAKLPYDFTLDIPPENAVWLYKAGIYATTARRYGIGWSNHMQRVILPVYDRGGSLLYVQARSEIVGQPKYVNKAGASRDAIYFQSKRSKHLLRKDILVVTEDILSAIRTGVYLCSCSTLGTALTDSVAYLLSHYKLIIVWYDDDKGGWDGADKAVKKLKSIGVPVIKYVGTKDPKHYTNQELQQILGGLIESKIKHNSS